MPMLLFADAAVNAPLCTPNAGKFTLLLENAVSLAVEFISPPTLTLEENTPLVPFKVPVKVPPVKFNLASKAVCVAVDIGKDNCVISVPPANNILVAAVADLIKEFPVIVDVT